MATTMLDLIHKHEEDDFQEFIAMDIAMLGVYLLQFQKVYRSIEDTDSLAQFAMSAMALKHLTKDMATMAEDLERHIATDVLSPSIVKSLKNVLSEEEEDEEEESNGT